MAVFVGSYCLRYHWNMKYDPGSSFWVSDPPVCLKNSLLACPDTLWMKLTLAAGINNLILFHYAEYIWRLEDQWVCLQFLSAMNSVCYKHPHHCRCYTNLSVQSRLHFTLTYSAVKLAICNVSRHVPWPQRKLQNTFQREDVASLGAQEGKKKKHKIIGLQKEKLNWTQITLHLWISWLEIISIFMPH